MQIGYDNCKDCTSRCEHAGKDREFVYSVSKGSCKTKRPKADLVAVVRCRECQYYTVNAHGFPVCIGILGLSGSPQYDDFCSYGKRKMEGNHEEL